MFKVGVGHSNDPNSLEAINETLEQCIRALDGLVPQAGILFTAIDFDHALILQRIHETFPNIELIGGTTDGEVSSVLEFQQDSLTLMLFCSDEVEILASVGKNISQNPVEISRQSIAATKQQLTLPIKFCIALTESLTTSTVSVLKGIELGLGNIPIFGGATADQWQYQQTYQFYKTEVLSDAVVTLLFAGNIAFSYGIASGWRPIGKRSSITKVDKNIIYEIDHKPALDFYHYYLNINEPDAVYPLAVFPPNETTFFLRGAIAYDKSIGSITMSGDIPPNSIVQITDTSIEDVIEASKTSFLKAKISYEGASPQAAIFFSCAWRRMILGTKANEEYKAIASLFPIFTSCGFYTYGEIAPLSANGKPFFHNTTFVTLLIGNQ
jgi:hypothetical protein